MAYVEPQYADFDEFKSYAGQGDISKATADGYLKAASAQIDSKTGSWFDSRAVTFKITVPRGSRFIRLPAPLISALVVVEETTTLDEIATPGGTGDFYTYSGFRSLRLEKVAGWTTYPKGVIITGTFGYKTSERIKTLCNAMAASIGDYRKHVFQNEDGDVTETPISIYPGWIQKELKLLKVLRNPSQVTEVTF